MTDNVARQLSLGDVVSESWNKLDGVKGSFWMAFIFFGLFSATLNVISKTLTTEGELWFLQIVFTLANYALNAVFSAGVLMMGAKCARGMVFSWKEMFEHFDQLFPLIIAGILVGIMQIVGYILLILPGIYVGIACAFTTLIIVDQKLGPIEAIKASFRLTHSSVENFFLLIAIWVVFVLIILVSCIPLLIGLVWTLPMGVIAFGIVYRELRGESEVSYDIQPIP